MSRTVVGYLDANGDAVNRFNVDVPLQLDAAKAIGRVTGHPDAGFPQKPEEYRRRSILVESQGHRGARGLWPESVVPTFARAMALGVHSLELDVHLTKDGVLVVYHDEVLQAGTVPDVFVGKRISELTAAQLSVINAAEVNPRYPGQQPVRWAAIPTLREVLDLANRLGWNGTWLIEAKSNPAEVSDWEAAEKQKEPWPESRVRELLGAIMDELADRDQAYRILDFDWRGVALASELATERTGNLPEGLVALVEKRDPEDLLRWIDDPEADIRNIPAAAKAAGATVLSVSDEMATPALMAQARVAGIAVSVWTVNNADRMRELIAMGVSGIISDHPDVLRSVLIEQGLDTPQSVTGTSTAADREAASAGLRRARETAAAAVGNDVHCERALDLLARVERLATEPSSSPAAQGNVRNDSGDRRAELASALDELAATARELGVADPTQLYTGSTATDPLARQLLDLRALDKHIAEIETRRVSDLPAWIVGVGESRELVVAADSDAELARAVAAAVSEDSSSEGLEARYVVSQGGAVRGRRGGFDGEPVSMRVLMSPSGDELLVGVFTRADDRWIERWLDRDGQSVPESEARKAAERIADEAVEHVNLPEFGHSLIGSGTPTPSGPTQSPETPSDANLPPAARDAANRLALNNFRSQLQLAAGGVWPGRSLALDRANRLKNLLEEADAAVERAGERAYLLEFDPAVFSEDGRAVVGFGNDRHAVSVPHGPGLETKYPSPDEVDRAEFRPRIEQLAPTALSPEAIAEAVCRPVRIDGISGFFDGRLSGLKSGEVLRGQRRAAETLDNAFWVSADIANLSGLNREFPRAEADFHFAKLAAIFYNALLESGAAVVPMRTGGDELGAVVVGTIGRATIAAAVATAEARVRAYAQEHSLSDIEHQKHKGRPEFNGVGLHVGYTEIVPRRKLKHIFNAADLGIEVSKKRSRNVSGEPGRAAGPDGADSPGTQAAHRGTGTRTRPGRAVGEGQAGSRAGAEEARGRGAEGQSGDALRGGVEYPQPDDVKRAAFLAEAARILDEPTGDATPEALMALYEPLHKDEVSDFCDARGDGPRSSRTGPGAPVGSRYRRIRLCRVGGAGQSRRPQ